MRYIVFFWLCLNLSGCNTGYDQQALAYDQSTCQQMGAKTDDQMYQCVMQQQQMRSNEEMRRRQAASVLGQQIMAQSRPQPVQFPRTTTCRPIGITVQCTTF